MVTADLGGVLDASISGVFVSSVLYIVLASTGHVRTGSNRLLFVAIVVPALLVHAQLSALMLSLSQREPAGTDPYRSRVYPSESSGKDVPGVVLDEYQLTGYRKIGIHEVMLADQPRMRAYRSAVLGGGDDVRGKVVLDVGAGTGILSLWAAKAGARKVIAIEYHPELAEKIRETAAKNGFGSRIEVLSGRVEDLPAALPGAPGGVVDVVVSEWMGYALLYESMLDSVILARDRWLRKDPAGLMLPGHARLFVVGASDPVNHDNKESFWRDVHGFDMTAYRAWSFRDASIAIPIPENLVTEPQVLNAWNLSSVSTAELEFARPLSLTLSRDAVVDVLTFYFDVSFTSGGRTTVLTTAPEAPPTHWQAVHFYLRKPYAGRAGETIRGRIAWSKGKTRKREVALAVTLARPGGKSTTDHFAIEY